MLGMKDKLANAQIKGIKKNVPQEIDREMLGNERCAHSPGALEGQLVEKERDFSQIAIESATGRQILAQDGGKVSPYSSSLNMEWTSSIWRELPIPAGVGRAADGSLFALSGSLIKHKPLSIS